MTTTQRLVYASPLEAMYALLGTDDDGGFIIQMPMTLRRYILDLLHDAEPTDSVDIEFEEAMVDEIGVKMDVRLFVQVKMYRRKAAAPVMSQKQKDDAVAMAQEFGHAELLVDLEQRAAAAAAAAAEIAR